MSTKVVALHGGGLMTSAALPIEDEPPDPSTLTVNEVTDAIDRHFDCVPGESVHFLCVLNGYVQQIRANNYTSQQLDDPTVLRIMVGLLSQPSTENGILPMLDTLLLNRDRGERSLMFQDLSADGKSRIALFIECDETSE